MLEQAAASLPRQNKCFVLFRDPADVSPFVVDNSSIYSGSRRVGSVVVVVVVASQQASFRCCSQTTKPSNGVSRRRRPFNDVGRLKRRRCHWRRDVGKKQEKDFSATRQLGTKMRKHAHSERERECVRVCVCERERENGGSNGKQRNTRIHLSILSGASTPPPPSISTS